MSVRFEKCCKIRCIVRVCQMVRRWRNKARMNRIPSDVPAGHVAVCVGSRCRRYVVKATYLNHPCFWKLLNVAEEEYGFCNDGPLTIPCEEALFEEVLRLISSSSRSGKEKEKEKEKEVIHNNNHRSCHGGFRSNNVELWQDCRPLLQG